MLVCQGIVLFFTAHLTHKSDEIARNSSRLFHFSARQGSFRHIVASIVIGYKWNFSTVIPRRFCRHLHN